jgi:hypothetical protein
MNKLVLLLGLFVVSCGSALAWNIQVEVDVYNASSCSVVVTGVKVSLQPSGGGASAMHLMALSPQVTLAPHASTHISASYAWPTDTLPGGDQSTVEFNDWDGTADSQALGLAGSWGGTTISVGGAANLTQPNVSFTIDYSNTSGSDEVCWVYFSNGDLVSDEYLVNPSYIDAESISSAYTPGGFSAPACYLPLHYVYSNAVAIISPPPSTNDVPASVTNAPPGLLTNSVPDFTNTPSLTNALPAVPNANSNVLWSDTSATLGGVGASVRDGLAAVNNALWTAGSQDHLDLSAVVNAVKNSSVQNHADNGVLKGAVDQVRLQAHSDALSAGTDRNLFGIQAHNDVQRVINAMASIGTNRAGSVNDTNGAQELTLQKVLASTTNATVAVIGSKTILGGISNLLASARSGGTNAGAAYAGVTNYGDAYSQVTSGVLSTALVGFQSLTTDFIAPAVPSDAMPSAVVDFPGTGLHIDLDPMHNASFVALANTSLHFISWILVCIYCFIVLKDITEFMRWLTDGKTASVPNLQIDILGTGGNEAGMIAAPIVTAACIFAWAVAIAAFMAVAFAVSGASIFSAFNSGPLGGGSVPAGAVTLLTAWFPLALFFSLITSYFVFRATANLAVFLAVAIMRALPG